MGVKQLVRIWWWACTVMVLTVSAWMWWTLASDGWATAFNKTGAAAVQTAGNPTSDYGQQVALIDVSVFVTLITLFTAGSLSRTGISQRTGCDGGSRMAAGCLSADGSAAPSSTSRSS